MLSVSLVMLEGLARGAHEALSAYRVGIGEAPLPAWENAEDWQKESSRKLAQSVVDGNVDPGAEHNRWFQERVAAGWTYGPVRNNATKVNPLLVPFEELPAREQQRTKVQIAVIEVLRKAYGL